MVKKIKTEELCYSGKLDDSRTNTRLILDDYDWMDYSLETRFTTKEQGSITIHFHYFGMKFSVMTATQVINGQLKKTKYKFDSAIFKKHILEFMRKHMESWEDAKYVFEDDVIVVNFFNEVLENHISCEENADSLF